MSQSTKAVPMSKDETMLFVQLVAAKTAIHSKATNATNNKMKDEAWQNLTHEFNSSLSSAPRTAAQLRLKWENLKKAARKRCASIRSNNIKTGGGRDYFPPDETLDKVASLLGSTSQGFSVEFGGDATMQCKENLNMGELVTSDGLGDGVYAEDAAKRKYKLEEDKCKARISRENAMTEYLISKKKKLDLENEVQEANLAKFKLDYEVQEANLAKLKLELETAKLENLKLKQELNLT